MTYEEAIKAELSKGIHAQLTDIVNKAVRKGYDLAKAEIVHCKDCKNNPSSAVDWISCPMTGAGTRKPNDFCSYAQRKTE